VFVTNFHPHPNHGKKERGFEVTLGCKDRGNNNKQQQGVYHIVALPFTLKSILRQKKNYGKLKNLFHHAKNRPNLPKKILLKKPKSFNRYYNSII